MVYAREIDIPKTELDAIAKAFQAAMGVCESEEYRTSIKQRSKQSDEYRTSIGRRLEQILASLEARRTSR
jgi:hypothetical protein